MKVNREHKDRLFKFIFQDKDKLLKLYNALNGTAKQWTLWMLLTGL